jgi:hypothetical protein
MPVIRFDIATRVNTAELDSLTAWKWFDLANTWIVDAFVDVTSKNMQRDFWKRET